MSKKTKTRVKKDSKERLQDWLILFSAFVADANDLLKILDELCKSIP